MTRVVRVLPDGTIDKTFDYLVPDSLGDQVRVGSLVRIELNGRRVGAWVLEDDVEPPDGVALKPVAKVTGWGPTPELVDLAGWASWRWAGRRSWFLGTASPEGAVRGLPPGKRLAAPVVSPVASPIDALVAEALRRSRAVLRLPPQSDPFPVVLAAANRGPSLVLAPSAELARRFGVRLRRAGIDAAIMPKDWAAGRAGAPVVVGSRAAAWAPVEGLAAVVVLDEHDEVYQEEQTTTWHARDVVAERARRAGVPCVLVSPIPTLEALAWAGGTDGSTAEAPGSGLIVPPRSVERTGWPVVDVIDRRDEEPGRAGLYSERLVKVLRSDARVVCVLNRKGRSRLLACATCGEAARCEVCASAVAQSEEGLLVCRRCQVGRPLVCQGCGGTKLKNLRAGVTRVREELEALLHEAVVDVAGPSATERLPDARVYVGTEAALHRVPGADVVAFLDLDQELLAPRYRAAEQALALVVRGSRVLARGAAQRQLAVSGRAGLGRLVFQTRMPDHEVVQAALHADPDRVRAAEQDRRRFLRFPPVTAMAAVSGVAAPAFMEAFGAPEGIEVLGPRDGRWLIRGSDHRTLCDALAATPRATGRLRIEVDPLRI